MTTAANPTVLICSACKEEFTASPRAGRKASICDSCYQLYLDPPEQTDPTLCRCCQDPIDQSPRQNANHGGRLSTYCQPCRQLHRKVVMLESKRKAREGE